MKRFLVFLIGSFFSLLILGFIGAFLLFSYYTQDLPDYKQLSTYDPSVVTRLYANNGRLFGEYAEERRVFLPISHIPQHIINTFLAAEDKNFYSHQGVDLKSIIRAIVQNLKKISLGKRPTGASTITQQVAKNFLLTNEVSLSRKIKEAILAFRLEKAYSKEKLLELYLNEIYLGGGAYGVAAAALYYFNKSLDELTIAEAAYLASLPKAPNSYHPVRNKEKALARRNWVIDQMIETGVITPEQGAQAKEEPLEAHFYTPRKNGIKADFFAEEVRRKVIEQFGEKELYQGGLTIKTTLDPRLQEIAEQVLRQGLINYDRRFGYRGPFKHIDINTASWQEQIKAIPDPPALSPYSLAIVLDVQSDKVAIGLKNEKTATIHFKDMEWARSPKVGKNGYPYVGPPLKSPSEVLKKGDIIAVEPTSQENSYALAQIPEIEGALVAIDPHTGRVLALAGGYSFEKSQFNRVTQALRQPGSAFKMLVYLTALEKGFPPNTKILDAPVEIDIGWGLGSWKPQNTTHEFYGEVTLRRAFERSLNVATVQLAKVLGISPIIETAIRLGISDKMPEHWATVLGAGETTLLRLTTAFAIIANGGKKITPTLIDRIQDRRGHTIYKADERTCLACLKTIDPLTTPPLLEDTRTTLISPSVAYQLTSLLEGTVERGTGKRAKVEGYPLAGKSGTSNDYKDVWFIGFNPNLAVGIFVGFDTPRSLGKHEEGGRVAAPIFGAFMKKALAGTAPIPFRVPKGVRFKKVNLETGEVAASSDKNIILEGFQPGTEPSEGVSIPVIGKDYNPPKDSSFSEDLEKDILQAVGEKENSLPLEKIPSEEDIGEAPFLLTPPDTENKNTTGTGGVF